MVNVEVIERITFSYDEDDDLIKLYETDYEWKKVSNSTTHVTFEYSKSGMFTSDDYRKSRLRMDNEGSEANDSN